MARPIHRQRRLKDWASPEVPVHQESADQACSCINNWTVMAP
jgi:hypothetical protein